MVGLEGEPLAEMARVSAACHSSPPLYQRGGGRSGVTLPVSPPKIIEVNATAHPKPAPHYSARLHAQKLQPPWDRTCWLGRHIGEGAASPGRQDEAALNFSSALHMGARVTFPPPPLIPTDADAARQTDLEAARDTAREACRAANMASCCCVLRGLTGWRWRRVWAARGGAAASVEGQTKRCTSATW